MYSKLHWLDNLLVVQTLDVALKTVVKRDLLPNCILK